MARTCLMVVALLAVLASPAFAQPRVEVSGVIGYTFSEGVSFAGTPINGAVYNKVDPASGVSFGLSFGGYITPQAEVEFLWSRQASTLEVSGSGPVLKGDMTVSNYHANFIYNAGEEDALARPFVFIGLGATGYSDAEFPGRTVSGLTKFSWSFGGGVKAWANRNLGFKGMVRWVPTYIKTEGYGWWCDPFYGCGAVGTAHYSHQFELAGGIVARF